MVDKDSEYICFDVFLLSVIGVRNFWPQHIFQGLTASENIYGARAQHVVIIEVVAIVI